MSKANHILQVAHQQLGFQELRPGQEEAIQSLLEGHDTLIVMPTGAGKSAIYQIAGALLRGPTVVVSPLIALQQDQVQSINDKSDDEVAAVVNSTLRSSERREVWEELEDGDLDFLFLAPEQFNNEETLERLRMAKPALFVVDEAHCVSAWGHDFRPDYLKLGRVIESLGHPLTLALTATAAPPVREEIVQQLSMREPAIIVQGFDRPNIHISVEQFDDQDSKVAELLKRVTEYVQNGEKPGIVYAATRKASEEICAELEKQGVKAVCYHAGFKADERERVQQEFMNDGAEVIVATVAFGMGIDKPNVRFVFHMDISESIDSYYQEIGRAGRDGATSHAILFYCQRDLGLRRFFTSGGHITTEEVKGVAQALAMHHENEDEPVEFQTLREETDLSQAKLHTVLHGLEGAGLAETLADGAITIESIPTSKEVKVVAEQTVEEQERHSRFERSRLEMMQGYAETQGCLRQYLLNYFGEIFVPDSNTLCCSNCDATAMAEVSDGVEHSHPFPLQSRVMHRTLGAGLVMRYEEDKMVVLFDDTGYKTLGVELVLENNLLQAAV